MEEMKKKNTELIHKQRNGCHIIKMTTMTKSIWALIFLSLYLFLSTLVAISSVFYLNSFFYIQISVAFDG